MPANMTPKQEGHETVVRAEPQYSQRPGSALGTAAPQEGQFSESGMA